MTREYLNAQKLAVCHCGTPFAHLFVQRVVSGHAETQYGYAEHPAQYAVVERKGKKTSRHDKTAPRKRCYLGRLSRYVTGKQCSCGRRIMRRSQDRCYRCRQEAAQ